MSVQAISWVLEHSKAQGSTRCVLISIANHVGSDGEGWAYVRQVMQEANCSVDTYQRAVQWAVDHGELERVVNRGNASKAAVNRRPNHFRLLLAPADCGPRKMHPPADCPPQEPQIAGPKPAHPEPSLVLEPSREPLPAKPGKTPAHLLTERHWNDVWPKPVLRGKFPALRSMVETLLEAGHTEDAILKALRETRSYTLDAIQFALRPSNGKQSNQAKSKANLANLVSR